MKFFGFLRNSIILQSLIGIVPAILILTYNILLLSDISSVYSAARKNADILKSDKSVIEVLEYSTDGDNVWSIKDLDGKELKVNNVNISVVLGGNEDIVYFSKNGSLLLNTVGKKYYNKLLIESNIISVIICWCVICAILLYCLFHKDFSILSRKTTLVVNLQMGVALVMIVVGGYMVF